MSQPDCDQIDALLRTVNREIWIVTAADGARRGGLTATWVSRASLDPAMPTLMAAIATNHFTAELIDAGGGFGVHLLRPDQVDLAVQFASGSGRDRDKLAGLESQVGETGSPLLADCLAWLDCRVFHRFVAGDRVFYWADIVAVQTVAAEPPLCEQEFFAAVGPDVLATLGAGLRADLEIQRPMYDDWRQSLDTEDD